MGRAGQQVVRDEVRLEDRISVGLLAKTFPRDRVEAVIEATGTRERRNRLLPAWVVVYYVLALALFMDMGGGRVMDRLSGALRWAGQGVLVPGVSQEALSKARARLGTAPLRLLFEQVAGPLATPGTAGAFWRGLRVVSLDGTTMDVQDTAANWEHFGGPSTKDAEGTVLRGGFPQVRMVALAECGTRTLIAARLGAYATGEKTLTGGLIERLDATMVVLADRNFPGYQLWSDAAATGAALVWRIGANFSLPIDEVLADGSYLSRLKVPKAQKSAGAEDVKVRIVSYHLTDDASEASDTFTLATTLLDPDTAPSLELAQLYHDRWQIETAFASLKSGLKGNGVVLRSKKPAGVEQEVWALLCVYHCICELICAAATLSSQDPLRVSFIGALDTARGPVGDPAAFPP